VSERPDAALAEVQQRVLDPFFAKLLDDAVEGESFADAAEVQSHPASPQFGASARYR